MYCKMDRVIGFLTVLAICAAPVSGAAQTRDADPRRPLPLDTLLVQVGSRASTGMPAVARGVDVIDGARLQALPVRGVTEGVLGPDLTLVATRRSIGAGTLPGGVGNIAAWIASSQHLKVGNGMPSYDQLEGRQLRALAAFLDSLR